MITMSRKLFASIGNLIGNVSYSQRRNYLRSKLINFTRGGGACALWGIEKKVGTAPLPFLLSSPRETGKAALDSSRIYFNQRSLPYLLARLVHASGLHTYSSNVLSPLHYQHSVKK